MPRDLDQPPPCTNGDCRRPIAAGCTNLFCRECCEEKCEWTCERAVREFAEPDDMPSF